MNKREVLERLRQEEEQIKILKLTLNELKLADDFLIGDRYYFEIISCGDSEYPSEARINKKNLSPEFKKKLHEIICEEIERLGIVIKNLEEEW